MTKIEFAIERVKELYNRTMDNDTMYGYGDIWLSDCYEIALRCMYEKKRNIEEGGDHLLRLEEEVQSYRDAASKYGIDAKTMLELAMSQITTSAENIKLANRLDELQSVFSDIPDIDPVVLQNAVEYYDSDSLKPFCDLVCIGLSVLQRYLEFSSEEGEQHSGS